MNGSQATPPVRDRRIVYPLAGVVVVLNAVGNSLLRVGLSEEPAQTALSPRGYIAAFANPWVILGIGLLILWLVLEFALLSWADLTYVLPISSLSYVLIALIGVFALRESMSAIHWCGLVLILAGAAIAGRTRPLTARTEVRR